jgi:ABC-2 type transport system permease protein
VLTVTGFAMIIACVPGVTVSSGEFRHQTATLTYPGFPRRSRVPAAKLIAAALTGLASGAAGSAVTTGTGLAFAAGHGYPIALAGTTIARYTAGAILGAALPAAAGVAPGTLVRAQPGAVTGVFAWALFVEPITGGLFNTAGPYLPFTAATTLAGSRLGGGGFGYSGSSSATALPFAAAAVLVAGLAIVLSFIASRTSLRHDIAR